MFPNHVTKFAGSEHVTDVEFLEFLEDIPRDNVHTEISDISIIKDCLAVHVFVTNLDWLLPDEIMQNPQSKNITLFWRLDTSHPTKDSLHFNTMIRDASLFSLEIENIQR